MTAAPRWILATALVVSACSGATGADTATTTSTAAPTATSTSTTSTSGTSTSSTVVATTSTAPPRRTSTTGTPGTAAAGGGECSPAYPDVCIPPPPPDLDCPEIPYRRFRVLAPDPHRFDADGDGIGCER